MKSILKLSNREKEKIYEDIDKLALKGNKLKLFDAGFPRVVLECGNISVLTDVHSFETWALKKKAREKHG